MTNPKLDDITFARFAPEAGEDGGLVYQGKTLIGFILESYDMTGGYDIEWNPPFGENMRDEDDRHAKSYSAAKRRVRELISQSVQR